MTLATRGLKSERDTRFVAPAATRSALLLPLAARPEQKLGSGPRRSLAGPVVYIAEVDRLRRRYYALVTSPLGSRVSNRRCRVGRSAGQPQSTAERLEPSALYLQLDATVPD